MFSLADAVFRYEPFPIGRVRPLMEPAIYERFVAEYPPLDVFEDYAKLGKPGNKFTLSERENRSRYLDFVRSNPLWREFHAWIKSPAFIWSTLEQLREHHLDLGFRRTSRGHELLRGLKRLLRGRPAAMQPRLTSRFEFSALPADGGEVVPHTDTASKIVTLVVSIVREGEWPAGFGGGTDVNRPTSASLAFNRINRLASFSEMEVVDSFPYESNQAVVFVKTFNSWHSVRPMQGEGSDLLRRTLTINIEVTR